jgi:anti-sigma factor RsiW
MKLPPEALLAGYVDGELTATERSAVEAWLQRDPGAAAELEAQRDLLRLWPTIPPPEPSPFTWARALTGITAGLALAGAAVSPVVVRAAKSPARRPGWVRAGLRWTGAAAAVLLVLVLNPMASQGPAPAPPAKPYPVVTADDVDIVTLNAVDADRLVVGNVPVRGPLDLAAPGDVVVLSIQPDVDGMLPSLHVHTENPSPMIVAPLGGGSDSDNPSP